MGEEINVETRMETDLENRAKINLETGMEKGSGTCLEGSPGSSVERS